MSNQDLVDLAVRMRAAQKRFFDTKSSAALKEAIDLEKQFDKAAKDRSLTPSLFGVND
jgi:hypothetical protein